MADLKKIELAGLKEVGKSWQEYLQEGVKLQALNAPDLLEDLTPEEESILEEILKSPAIQVRFKALFFSLILNSLEGKLKWIPFKGRILSKVWEELNQQLDKLIDWAEDWYQKRGKDE